VEPVRPVNICDGGYCGGECYACRLKAALDLVERMAARIKQSGPSCDAVLLALAQEARETLAKAKWEAT
jgi:hypothetical protein